MAVNFATANSGQVQAPDADYPYGKPRDVSVSGDGLGTPWKAANYTEIQGFLQAILTQAGVVPNGNPETALASQYLEALKVVTGSANAIYPVSTGSTTPQSGVPACETFSVTLPGTLIDAAVYRFLPHATNRSDVASTINGKAVVQYVFDGMTATTPVRYKAIRPGIICELRYDQTSDHFVVVNPKESIIIHGSFTAGLASGTTLPHGWNFERLTTGRYEITHNLGALCHALCAATTGALVAQHFTSAENTVTVSVRDFTGASVNDGTGVLFSLVF